MSGDLIKHDYDPGSLHKGVEALTIQNKIDTVSAMFANVSQLIETRFPNAPLLMSMGNNDGVIHYYPPGADIDTSRWDEVPNRKSIYLENSYKGFFTNIEAN